MGIAKDLVHGTSWMVLSDVIGNMLSFFLVLFIARHLGSPGLGVYSYAIAFVSLFYFLLDTGTLNYVTREISRDLSRGQSYIKNLMTLRLFFCFLAFLLSIILIFVIQNDPKISLIVFLAAIAMFFNYFSWTLRPIFQAHGKLKFEAISRILERTAAFILGIFFVVFLRKGIIYVMITLIISYLLFYVSRIFFAKKFCQLKFGFDIQLMKKMFIKSMPFWFTVLFFKLYYTMDTLMLSWLTHDYAAVGIYNAAYKVLDGLKFIPAIAGIVLFPVMSKLFIENKEKLQKLLDLSLKYMWMLIVPLTIIIIFTAKRAMPFLFTEAFIESGLVLQILIVAGSLGFVSYILGHFLQAINKQFFYAIIIALGTFVNITLNIFLIPRFSYIGAAIATVFTEIICFVFFYFLILRMKFRITLLKSTYPIILAGTIMGICMYCLKDRHLIVLAPTGVLLYLIALFLFGGIRQQEFDLVKHVIKKDN